MRELLHPAALRRGDRVEIVAPSGPVNPERLRRGCALLATWGLEVTLGAHVLDRDPHAPYLAGRDADRAADLQRAWCDPAVSAVSCARGGYGAGRLLAHLDWRQMRAARPKPLLGSSDVTALHQAWATHLRVVTLFAPMAAGEVLGEPVPDPASAAHLRARLFEPESVTRLAATEPRVLVGGRAAGVTVGGTISLLAAGVGTPDVWPAAGGVAVLEDVDEPAYRLDRYLTQLLRSGWFDRVRAVALGSFVGCGPDAVAVVGRRLAGLGVPVLAGFAVGHGAPQLTVPLGVAAMLDADAGTLALGAAALT